MIRESPSRQSVQLEMLSLLCVCAFVSVPELLATEAGRVEVRLLALHSHTNDHSLVHAKNVSIQSVVQPVFIEFLKPDIYVRFCW